jgi:cytochrome c peroxidase
VLKTFIISAIVILSCYVNFSFTNDDSFNASKNVDAVYSKQLLQLKKDIGRLEILLKGNGSPSALQQQFRKARFSYKKAAILIEYFNLYEAAFLNGPPIDRVEDDNPDKIIHPEGFGMIEQLIFTNEKTNGLQLTSLSTRMLEQITKLENETDRSNKFQNESVWSAMQAAVIRLTSLGITGFDSPVAFNSIPEAKATLEGLQQLADIYKPFIEKANAGAIKKLYALLGNAENYLSVHSSFNSFDRLSFIKNNLDPLYATITKIKNSFFSIEEGLNPIRRDAKNIFDENAFDLRYFSPEKDYVATPERIELGRILFYDSALSGTGKRSCASCHQPEKGFTDGLAKALAIDNKTSLNRNTPGLWNSCFQTKLFWDSRADILENQAEAVVHNVREMQGSFKNTMEDIKRSSYYSDLFAKAYPAQKEPVSGFNIANAIASYERSLVSFDSRFDLYMRGDNSKLSAAEKNGFNLFMGKAKCGTCHFAPAFNGLLPPQYTKTESEVIGVPATTDTINPKLDGDLGKYLFTLSEVDKFSFKTPTLRNIELTAPYMHNGVYKTLEEVVDFYNKGGGKGLHIAPENQTLPFDKLDLTKKEKADLVLFMRSLTDTVHVGNKK